MKLDRVTITGADDDTSPLDIMELSKKHPFVERGILVSENNAGNRRFPSRAWRERFQELVFLSMRRDPALKVQLCAHLCGKFVRDLLRGNDTLYMAWYIGFQRVQLNFHGEKVGSYDPVAFTNALKRYPGIQWIFQIDGKHGLQYFKNAVEADVDAVPLYDTSGGLGELINLDNVEPLLRGDIPYDTIYHGFAGGLSPENVAEQIRAIEERFSWSSCSYWIDVETYVRGRTEDVLDMKRVEAFIEAARPFTGYPATNTILEGAQRPDDMSPDGFIRVCETGGDVELMVRGRNEKTDEMDEVVVRLCTPGMGGGRSPHTLKLLKDLMAAMERDNREHPHKDGKTWRR